MSRRIPLFFAVSAFLIPVLNTAAADHIGAVEGISNPITLYPQTPYLQIHLSHKHMIKLR